MTDLVLHASRELSKRTVVLADQKIGIVSKTVFAPRLRDDESSTTAFGGQTNGASRIGESDRADVAGSSPFERDAGKFFHEFAVVKPSEAAPVMGISPL